MISIKEIMLNPEHNPTRPPNAAKRLKYDRQIGTTMYLLRCLPIKSKVPKSLSRSYLLPPKLSK